MAQIVLEHAALVNLALANVVSGTIVSGISVGDVEKGARGNQDHPARGPGGPPSGPNSSGLISKNPHKQSLVRENHMTNMCCLFD